MGKSYVENSLKRFLKRKVKITLGLVVTFMITGAVAFGAEEGSIIEGKNWKQWIYASYWNITGLRNEKLISCWRNYNQYGNQKKQQIRQ